MHLVTWQPYHHWLAERYGCTRCWFCGRHLPPDGVCVGDPGLVVSIEHVLARSLGGGSVVDNQRLAHARCNSAAGSLPVAEKLAMRVRWHAANGCELPADVIVPLAAGAAVLKVRKCEL